MWSSSRPAPTDHRPAARVNRDASLSVAPPASGSSAPHACGGHDGSPDSAVQPAEPSGGAPAAHSRRRSRADRGRSNCKRSPGGGNRRTGTDGPMADRAALLRRCDMDGRHCWQDSRPACVPGTMWGTAPMLNLQVVRGAVLAPQVWQAAAAPSSRLPGFIPAQTRAVTHPTSLSSSSSSAVRPRGHAVRRCPPPSTRGFSPPLTQRPVPASSTFTEPDSSGVNQYFRPGRYSALRTPDRLPQR